MLSRANRCLSVERAEFSWLPPFLLILRPRQNNGVAWRTFKILATKIEIRNEGQTFIPMVLQWSHIPKGSELLVCRTCGCLCVLGCRPEAWTSSRIFECQQQRRVEPWRKNRGDATLVNLSRKFWYHDVTCLRYFFLLLVEEEKPSQANHVKIRYASKILLKQPLLQDYRIASKNTVGWEVW